MKNSSVTPPFSGEEREREGIAETHQEFDVEASGDFYSLCDSLRI